MNHDMHAHSPLQILAESPSGALAAGQLGVVTARAGVGKTAFLVQVGLDHLLNGKKVLHVALGGQEVHQVKSWYDTLFRDLANVSAFEDSAELQGRLESQRLILAYNAENAKANQIERTLNLYARHMAFEPDVILVDDQHWDLNPIVIAAALGALKSTAERLGAQIWMTARVHRDDEVTHNLGIAPPVDAFDAIVDVVMALEPEDDHVTLRLLKDRSDKAPRDLTLTLQGDTMRVLSVGGERSTVSLPADVCTLLSGAAKGTEQAFGEMAERWGLKEINYSFEGRPVARSRGIVLLTETQLRKGNVSERYLQEHMKRTYPNTPLFKKVLQSIWHEVNTANQVFVVGLILEDNTVKGGTGWAAELAKHLKKELYVFDQEKRSWHVWDGSAWQELDESPRITSRRFTGTGSRYLSDQGRQAIEALFVESFGPSPEAA